MKATQPTLIIFSGWNYLELSNVLVVGGGGLELFSQDSIHMPLAGRGTNSSRHMLAVDVIETERQIAALKPKTQKATHSEFNL